MSRSLRCSVPFALALLSASVWAAPQDQTLPLLPKDVQEQLPTAEANLARARAVDAEFWVDHGEALTATSLPL
jgi:putative spermidine/putrescine transport system substrate-binding protein